MQRYEIIATRNQTDSDDVYSGTDSAKRELTRLIPFVSVNQEFHVYDRAWYAPDSGSHCVIAVECRPFDGDVVRMILSAVASRHFDTFQIIDSGDVE